MYAGEIRLYRDECNRKHGLNRNECYIWEFSRILAVSWVIELYGRSILTFMQVRAEIQIEKLELLFKLQKLPAKEKIMLNVDGVRADKWQQLTLVRL